MPNGIERAAEQRRKWHLRRALLGLDDDESDGGLGEADADEIARRVERIRRWKSRHLEPVAIRVVRDPQLQRLVKGRDREE
jgi:hypothetical protein